MIEVHFLRTRFALVAAVSLALFVAGLASGSAGESLVIGHENVAGTSTTTLISNAASDATLLVRQDGTGTAIRGSSNTGIAGFFTSADGSALSAVVADPDSFGLYVSNDAEDGGTGAAVRANAAENVAVAATSRGTSPLHLSGPDEEPPMVVNSAVQVANLHADGVDGWSFGCPAETVWTGTLCVESTARDAAPILEAADTCQSAEADGGDWQFQLPTALQLRAVSEVRGVDISEAGEHTDSLFGSADGVGTLVVHPDGRIAAADAGDAFAFRCATVPMWPDAALDTSE